IDGQVAALQVFFQRDVGGGVKGKAVVARGGLALGARQRAFLVGVGVEEDGEVTPHRGVALGQQGLRLCADQHPIAVAFGAPEESIAYIAALLLSLHWLSFSVSSPPDSNRSRHSVSPMRA